MSEPPLDTVMSHRTVAELLEENFGVRPALVTLRVAAHRRERTTATASITAGIPAPLPDGQGFLAQDIHDWIAHHPWRTRAAALDTLERSSKTDPAGREAAVEGARRAGLSWAHIAQAIATADGATYTHEAARKRYGR